MQSKPQPSGVLVSPDHELPEELLVLILEAMLPSIWPFASTCRAARRLGRHVALREMVRLHSLITHSSEPPLSVTPPRTTGKGLFPVFGVHAALEKGVQRGVPVEIAGEELWLSGYERALTKVGGCFLRGVRHAIVACDRGLSFEAACEMLADANLAFGSSNSTLNCEMRPLSSDGSRAQSPEAGCAESCSTDVDDSINAPTRPTPGFYRIDRAKLGWETSQRHSYLLALHGGRCRKRWTGSARKADKDVLCVFRPQTGFTGTMRMPAEGCTLVSVEEAREGWVWLHMHSRDNCVHAVESGGVLSAEHCAGGACVQGKRVLEFNLLTGVLPDRDQLEGLLGREATLSYARLRQRSHLCSEATWAVGVSIDDDELRLLMRGKPCSFLNC